MRRLVCILVGVYVALVIASLSLAGDDGKTLVHDNCGSCHSLVRVCEALGRMDKAAWTATVDRMVGYGTDLDPSQRAVVAAYLAGLAPGASPVCQ